jgi:hypothetical protein
VRLSQSIIDAAIEDCKDQPTWGIDLPDVHVNYITGVVLEAAIVLHNGNDVERLVKIECSPRFVTTVVPKGTLKGTVTFTQTSAIVVGVGTRFATELAIGDYVGASGGTQWYRVVTIGSNTTITIMPAFAQTTISGSAGSSGIGYDPSPLLVQKWLTPEIDTVRLGLMETRVVKVTLAVPGAAKGLPKYWAVGVSASGMPIVTREQKVLVTTSDIIDPKTKVVTPDTVLTFHLDAPLLEGIKSILSIKSTIDESLHVVSYNGEKGLLTIDGLKSNQVREVTVTYEPVLSQAGAYEQTWLITMMLLEAPK